MLTFDRLDPRDLPSVSVTGSVLRIDGGSDLTQIQVESLDDGRIAVFEGFNTYFFDGDKIKLIRYVTSPEGGDQFIDSTDEKAIAILKGKFNAIAGIPLVIDLSINSYVEESA